MTEEWDLLIRGVASGGRFDVTKGLNAEDRTEVSCIEKRWNSRAFIEQKAESWRIRKECF